MRILLDDGTPYPLAGKLLFVDRTVDEATGEVMVRAQVPNPQGDLLPGQYVRALVTQAVYPRAYLMPQQAVTLGKVATVLLVKADGSFMPQPVTLVGRKDTDYIVAAGLEDGDRVIVEGTSALAFGARKVRTRPWHDPFGDAGAGKRKETSDATHSPSVGTKKAGARDLTENGPAGAASGTSAN